MKITIDINDTFAGIVKKICTPFSIVFILSAIFFSIGIFTFSQEIIKPKPYTFKSGDVISAEKFNVNFDTLNDNIVKLNNRTLESLSNVDIEGLGNGKVLKYNNGEWKIEDDLVSNGGGDNLGNHTAAQNINLNGNWLSGTGTNNGIFINANGNVGIGMNTPAYTMDIAGTLKADSFSLKGLTIDGHSLDAADGNPVDVVYVNNTGDVGIGTTTPASKLSVKCEKQGPIDKERRAAIMGWNDGGDTSYSNPIGIYGKADSNYATNGFAGYFEGRGYFSGNVGIGTEIPTRMLFVDGTAGGTTGWSNDSHSSYKQKFTEVEVIEKVKQLKIKEWEYKPEHTTADNSRHISPFSEDFYAIFGLGDNEKQIQALDVAGVALKAVQEQQKIIDKQQEIIDELIKEVEKLKMQ
ncbi:MAG: hypothetical protein JXJ04_01615 [Spirochaetales bacterium]|nr:hypothetical protein [Spirochaetales bacterium]